MILDIHSHRQPPYPEGIVSLDALSPLPTAGDSSVAAPDALPGEGQYYSAGIHPWDTDRTPTDEDWKRLETLAADPRVCAIGECGVDLGRGAPLFRQLLVLKRQIELAESVGKPVIFHCVKGADILMGLKSDFQPRQPWIIHGFRGKPALAAQLTDKGFYISLGEKFNPETAASLPEERLLAETDESPLPIREIIARISEAAGRDVLPLIEANIKSIWGWT